MEKKCFSVFFVYLFCFLEPTLASESGYFFWGSGDNSSKRQSFKLEELESKGKKIITSSFFDKGMGLKGTKLTVVPFYRMIEMFPPPTNMDSILMDGDDDYQAIISLDQGKKYDLYWATKIKTSHGGKKPDWMNPLALVVPNSSNPPDVERFLPANIKNLRYAQWKNYYKPVTVVLQKSARKVQAGFEAFVNDCLYCHSLKGIGGNKGGDLTTKFQLALKSGQKRFVKAFGIKHYREGKYASMGEFAHSKKAQKIAEFLSIFSKN